MPSYNHGHLIARAIDSVLAQSYPHWELIIVDNHSTDNTRELLQTYADPRIQLLQIHNQGIIAASRNKGVRQARGEWIAFLDSDDWWTPEKLSACMQRLQPTVDVLYHDLALVGVGTGFFRRKQIHCWQTRTPVLQDLLVRGNALATSSVMARRDLLLQVTDRIETREFSAAADYACWLNLAQLTDGFLYLPMVLGSYLMHGQGVSRRDMSEPTTRACAPFVHVLSPGQLRIHQSSLRYARGRHLFTNGQRVAAVPELKFAVAASNSVEIRLKALVMLCLYYLGRKA
jgi:glycosyltransferase involved in cell wall biosynthesis